MLLLFENHIFNFWEVCETVHEKSTFWGCVVLRPVGDIYSFQILSKQQRFALKENSSGQRNKRPLFKILGKTSSSNITQSSILWFCGAFSSHIKSFSHSASPGSSRIVPLWVAGMVCLLHMKEMSLSCFMQLFIHHGTASEKVRERPISLWLAVCKLIGLFGFGRLHAPHIWSNQIANYVVSDFMFRSSCDKLNYP